MITGLYKKGMVLGIICLFIGAGFLPIMQSTKINLNNNYGGEITNNDYKEGLCDLESNSSGQRVDYFITAEDHPDVLDDSSVDNIAIITLSGEDNIDISDIKIMISNDMVNWIETYITRIGIWEPGNQITIREICLDEVKSSCYSVRLIIPSKNIYPIAETMICVDNASIDTFVDERLIYLGLVSGDDVGGIKSSKAWASTDYHPPVNYTNMALSVEFDKIVWDDWGYWEYYFNLDAFEQSPLGWTTRMNVDADASGIYNKYYPIVGSTGMDETPEEDWTMIKVAYIVCAAVIGYICPLVVPLVTGYELAQLLLKSPDESDLEWHNSYPWWEQPAFHNCFGQMRLSVPVNSDWDVDINLETVFRPSLSDPERYSVFLDSDNDRPGLHRHGEGTIVFGGTSPSHPDVIKEERARAVLATDFQSCLVDWDFSTTNFYGQADVLSSLGIMQPVDGDTFLLMSTGIAGANPVTTSYSDPGSESGTDFGGDTQRDYAELTLELDTSGHEYVYYDLQYFSTDYPEKTAGYIDEFTVEVDSPSMGKTTYTVDVNSGDFVLNPLDMPNTGFDIFSTTGDASTRSNEVTTTPGPGSDAGATALVTREHHVSPDEVITVTFRIEDNGDNLCDSAVYIDNLMLSGGEPDLNCAGTLSWSDVLPGSTVEGTIYVENAGATGTDLDWEIVDFPWWGDWTFTPSSGDNLKPDDGPVTINVAVKAPNVNNNDYTGEIKIWNKNDHSDYCLIDAELSTSYNPSITINKPQPGHLYASFTGDEGMPMPFFGSLILYIYEDNVRAIACAVDEVKFKIEQKGNIVRTKTVESENEIFNYNFGKLPIGMYTLTAEGYQGGSKVSSDSVSRIFILNP